MHEVSGVRSGGKRIICLTLPRDESAHSYDRWTECLQLSELLSQARRSPGGPLLPVASPVGRQEPHFF